MIKSKTYNGLEGTNYIQAAELAYTTVYAVKREGLLHEKYNTGDPNRTHSYDSSMGRIYFPLNFNPGGEKVFVIYKESSAVPVVIPVCENVSISGTLPNGVIGSPYVYSFFLSGSTPFAISGITAPAWATVELSGTLVDVYGTPDTETTETIEFTITNCSSGAQTINQSFDIIDPAVPMYVNNAATSGVFITSVGGISYVILSGSLPVGSLQSMSVVHPDYTGIIGVGITGVIFPISLKLYKNSVLLETLPVTGPGGYIFASQTYLSSDSIEILLQ